VSEPARPPIRMEIKGLMIDPSSNNPIVILRDPESETFLPIWIGLFEASAIQLGLEAVDSPRPRTHDLLAATVAALGGEVQRVVVQDLRDQTFYAIVYIARDGQEEVEIDARPSDAIALALRTQAPVFVTPDVLEKAHVGATVDGQDEQGRLKKLLEDLDPEDLGEYEM
jgi:bifunctional DNase/RNase